MVARLLFVALKWHTASNRRVLGLPPRPTVGHERLLRGYGRAREGSERLSDRLQEVKLENKALRGTVADFEQVKRAFGPEEVARAVEDAKRREAQEREQKKAKRKFSRGAR
jgi:hypothetical protein